MISSVNSLSNRTIAFGINWTLCKRAAENWFSSEWQITLNVAKSVAYLTQLWQPKNCRQNWDDSKYGT